MISLPQISRTVYCLLILVFVCFFTYKSTLHNEFKLDDFAILLAQRSEPQSVFQVISFQNIKNGFYRPVSDLYRFFLTSKLEVNPFYYHCINLVLLTTHIILMFFVLKKLFGKNLLSLMICLLYTIHPINGMVGNYVIAQEILLFGIFLDLSLLCLLCYLGSSYKKFFYGASIVSFIFALLSHEIAISFVFIPILIVFQFLRISPLSRALKICGPYLIIAVLFSVSRFMLLLETSDSVARILNYVSSVQMNVCVYLNSVTELVGWYLKQLVIPTEIVLAKTMPPQKFGIVSKAIALSFFSIIGFVLFRKKWAGNPWLLGTLWLLSGFVPYYGIALIRPSSGFVMQPHWFFFSSLGFFITVGLFFEYLLLMTRNVYWKIIGVLLFLFLMIGLFSVTQTYNQIWRTQKSYCLHWLHVSHDFYFPNFWLAQTYAEEKNFKLAEFHYNKSFSGKKSDWYVYAGLGDIAAQQGDFQQTRKYYLEALKINPDDQRLISNIRWMDRQTWLDPQE